MTDARAWNLAFDIRPAFVHGRHLQLCLISRRSRYRAGTRYFRRGIDHEGHVANFNETEQLVLVEDQQSGGQRGFDDFSTKLSFVQIRGSVPVFWAEINTLRYKPDLQVMDLQDTVRPTHKLVLIISEYIPGQCNASSFSRANLFVRGAEACQFGKSQGLRATSQRGVRKIRSSGTSEYLPFLLPRGLQVVCRSTYLKSVMSILTSTTNAST